MDSPETAPSRAAASVYLSIRRGFPDVGSYRLRKDLLIALSRTFEREIRERADRPLLFGGFQREPFLRDALPRWQRLAERARSTVVFLEDGTGRRVGGGIVCAGLAPDAPLRHEWVVVCDDPAFAAVISAWEIPVEPRVEDRERLFEVVWSLETEPVRLASRVCAGLAVADGLAGADDLVRELAADPGPSPDLRTGSNVLGRVLARLGGVV